MVEFKTVGEAVKAYVEKRDALRLWQKQVNEEEAQRKLELEEIDQYLLTIADEMGVESFKTPFGTAYKSKKEHYRINDWPAFVEYIKQTNNFQLFEKRVAKLAVKEIHQQDGLPLGLDYSSEYTMGVNRATKKKEKTDDGN